MDTKSRGDSCREKSPSGSNRRASEIILLWVVGLWASFALYVYSHARSVNRNFYLYGKNLKNVRWPINILNFLEQPPCFSHPNVVFSHLSGSFLFRLDRGFITLGALIYFSTSLSITSKYSE